MMKQLYWPMEMYKPRRKNYLCKMAKGVYGWSSVETYGFSIHKETGKTLREIRGEYMGKESSEDS